MKTTKTTKTTNPNVTPKGRSKGTGTLVKRGKVYFAQWVHEGKTYKRTTQTGSRREAEKKLIEFTAPFRLGGEAQTLETIKAKLGGVQDELQRHEDGKPQLTLADMWEAYLDSPNRPDTGIKTLEQYAFQVNRFVSWMTSEYPKVIEMRDVTEKHVSKFCSFMIQSYSPNTYNKYITLLKRTWKVLKKESKATLNPFENIQTKNLDTHSRRELTVEELSKVCSSVEGELKLLFAIGIFTALRLGDCALLKWSNVDLVKNIISVIPSKTARSKKAVVIPIHDSLRGMLIENHNPKGKSKDYVLPALSEIYKKNPATLSRQIQGVFEDCGIETKSQNERRSKQSVNVGFHSLRHTFVSLSANAGTPLAVVQSIVGHSNPSMTSHYYHASIEAQSKAVNALPSLSDNKPRILEDTRDRVEINLNGMNEAELKALIKEAKTALKERLAND